MTDTPHTTIQSDSETTYYYAKQQILPPEDSTKQHQQVSRLGQKTQLALASKEASHFSAILAITCLGLALILLSMNKVAPTAAMAPSAATPQYNITNHYHYAPPQTTQPGDSHEIGDALREMASSLKQGFDNLVPQLSAPVQYAPPPSHAVVADKTSDETPAAAGSTINVHAVQNITYNEYRDTPARAARVKRPNYNYNQKAAAPPPPSAFANSQQIYINGAQQPNVTRQRSITHNDMIEETAARYSELFR